MHVCTVLHAQYKAGSCYQERCGTGGIVMQVVLCSACSGHGYKFCSIIGEILADLSMRGNTSHDIEFLRMNAQRPGQEGLMTAFHGKALDERPAPPAYHTSKL